MANPDRDADFDRTLDLLAEALPDVVRMLRSKSPRRPPLTANQFRRLVRAVWEHAYDYGIAHEMEHPEQQKGLGS